MPDELVVYELTREFIMRKRARGLGLGLLIVLVVGLARAMMLWA